MKPTIRDAFAALCVGALWACGCSAEPIDGRSAAARAAPNGGPTSSEDQDGADPETCVDRPAPRVPGWTTHTSSHFSFQAPSAWVVSRSFDGNVDPAVSPWFAEIAVETTPTGAAFGFAVTVSELAKRGEPADRLAQLATQPHGTPTETNTCGVIDASQTAYGCDASVDWMTTCRTIRGFSSQWRREVYHGERTFLIVCGATLMPDEAKTCAAVLDSLTLTM